MSLFKYKPITLNQDKTIDEFCSLMGNNISTYYKITRIRNTYEFERENI
ncbi:hypothetical protein [Halarcobacter anaerophilus]|nr:hypothetical protein [Halarcobacter anaerophilus]